MASTQPRPLELDLLCRKLDNDFSAFIIGRGSDAEARRSNFYSKAIAAFLLCEEAGATPDQAVAASIDGGFDHGIDSVFIAADETLWLVQSKYKEAGTGEPDLGDVAKFRDGVIDLLMGKWERFNTALQQRTIALKNALNSGACRVRVVLVYTGTAISDDRRDIFGDLERAFNATNHGFLSCSAYGLSTLHDLHLDGLAAPRIDADIELFDYGHTRAPYRAFYGRIAAKRLAELWLTYNDHLVERNIRRFKGSTTVNEGLSETIQQEAKHFFYFNNGVTFLCDTIRQSHPLDPHRQHGHFHIEGLSIINGAQTVGAIAREPIAHYDAHPVEVMATFVCLENAPVDFGNQVTRYRNRQNAVDLEDFAALDERQVSWKQTLEIAGIEYQIKRGDDDAPTSETCFSIQEAACILACTLTTRDWQEFVVAAKTDKKKLFGREGFVAPTDPLCDAYKRIFPDSLTARQIWRAVQIGRIVKAKILDRASAEADPMNIPLGTLPAKEILKHGWWLMLHVLLIRLHLQNAQSLTLTQDELDRLSIALDQMAQCLVDVVQAIQWNKQARSVFENRTDCITVKARLMAALAQQR